MTFQPYFKVGSTVSNADIIEEFKVANMGGMRRSKQTNTLVIISDHTKGLYEDKWYGDILHYTGMGKTNDQDINFKQNKTLAESGMNGVSVHLFEVLKASEYIYLGEVELCDRPYQETQPGEDDVQRNVWMFPVRLKSSETPIDISILKENEEVKSRQARRLNDDELKRRAENNQSEKAALRSVQSTVFLRDPFVTEFAKRRANGHCQLCGEKAPFDDRDGNPYLETHHIVWLSKGGADSIDNTAALCPNCHRRMHVLDLDEDKVKLGSVKHLR